MVPSNRAAASKAPILKATGAGAGAAAVGAGFGGAAGSLFGEQAASVASAAIATKDLARAMANSDVEPDPNAGCAETKKAAPEGGPSNPGESS